MNFAYFACDISLYGIEYRKYCDDLYHQRHQLSHWMECRIGSLGLLQNLVLGLQHLLFSTCATVRWQSHYRIHLPHAEQQIQVCKYDHRWQYYSKHCSSCHPHCFSHDEAISIRICPVISILILYRSGV